MDSTDQSQPVRSAKDAINAMYAADPDKRLSSYLASTAQEIINASGEKPSSDSKSAASLHHQSGRRKMESTRPSASALFRMAKSKSERTPPPRPTTNAADPLLEVEPPVLPKHPAPKEHKITPVVHTSLKLSPKKPPLVIKPQAAPAPSSRPNDGSNQSSPSSCQLRPAKGKITLTSPQSNNSTAADQAKTTSAKAKSAPAETTQKAVASIQKAAATALKPKTAPSAPAAQPKADSVKARGRIMDVAPRPASTNQLEPPTSASAEDVIYTARATKAVAKPTRSVKSRFRPAPRGYATHAEPSRSETYADFSNPDHPIKAQHLSLPAPSSVDIYAEVDTSVPDAKAQSKKNAEAGLGVVRDYRPQGDRVENRPLLENAVAGGHGAAAPDNNRYALGGQSPFFLKTVQVEKRPLSDGPRRNSSESAGTIYAAPNFADADSKGNYNKKSAKKSKSKAKSKPAKVSKKALRQDLPTRPTVIVPPSRRSHAPLFFLLIVTILLGAAVGALSYLCFFQ